MACTRIFYALLLALSLRTFHSYHLMTRFKNPNEYVARDDFSVLDDFDETTLQYLLQELPDLKDYINKRKSNFPYDETEFYNASDNAGLDQYYNEYEDKEEISNATFEELDLEDSIAENQSSTTYAPKMRFITRWPQGKHALSPNVTTEANRTRKFLSFLSWLSPYQGRRVARCYWCGLNATDRIPRNPICHDAFDSQDHRARTLARFFRAHCHFNRYHGWAWRKKPWRATSYSAWNLYGNGLIGAYYGRFLGGCFKRFLDVGSVYTQRGCRSWWPRKSWHFFGTTARHDGYTFAAHRYSAMERPLRYFKRDICIISPHASLTPFHRSISLYVRYHVCICFKKWCNKGTSIGMSPTLTLTNVIFMIIYYVVMYLSLFLFHLIQSNTQLG